MVNKKLVKRRRWRDGEDQDFRYPVWIDMLLSKDDEVEWNDDDEHSNKFCSALKMIILYILSSQ